MQNNTLWNLENADQAAKDIQFWQAEYMKRQFMSEPDYDVIVAQCNEIKRKWTMYLQNNKDLSINNLEKTLSFWHAFLQWRQAYEREIMGSV